MAYRHYETEGLIVGHCNLGEANRLYQVLTARFGLINVWAQGVRRGQSKLHFHLEDFSFVQIVLVRGKEFWRLVGASSSGDFSFSRGGALLFLKKISLVVQRLVHGEELNSLIYQDVKQSRLLIAERADLSKEQWVDLEVFVVARLLKQLGYLSPLPELEEFFLPEKFSWSEVSGISKYRHLLIMQINKALSNAQL